MQEYEGNRICLNLLPAQEHLSATNQKEQLQAALRSRFDAEIRLVVTVEASEDETPAQREARKDIEAKRAALADVEKDPDVDLFRDTFDATIDKESIRYLGSE